MNILEQADQIVNHRSEEKERTYGPFSESMDRMRDIFNGMTGLDLDTVHMFKAMIALKLSREAYSHREDNLLDICGYVGAMNNYIDEFEEQDETVSRSEDLGKQLHSIKISRFQDATGYEYVIKTGDPKESTLMQLLGNTRKILFDLNNSDGLPSDKLYIKVADQIQAIDKILKLFKK